MKLRISVLFLSMMLLIGHITPSSSATLTPSVQPVVQTSNDGVRVELAIPQPTFSNTAQGVMLSLTDWQNEQRAGAPQLPVKSMLIAVPAGKRAVLADWQVSSARTYRGRPTIQPQQKLADRATPFADSRTQLALSDELDPTLSNAVYPAQAVMLGEPFTFREQTLVPLQVYAAQWDARRNIIQTFNHAHVEIRFVATNQAASVRSDPLWTQQTRSAVINPTTINDVPAVQPARPALVQNTVGLRVSLANSGLYKITFQQMLNAGAPTIWRDSSQFLRVYQGNVELPRLLQSDGILFYLPKYDTLQSDKGSVILRYTQGLAGLTPSTRTITAGAGGSTTFNDQLHYEEQFLYISRLPREDFRDHWWSSYWYVTGNGNKGTPIVQTVNLAADALFNQSAQLKLRLQGFSNTMHNAEVWLNGTLVGAVQWENQDQHTQTLSIPANVLATTNVISIAPQGLNYDFILFDWLEISYRRPLQVNGYLEFAGDATSYSVAGLAGAMVDVWDVTNPNAPQVLSGWTNTDALRWNDTANRRYVVQNRAQARSPLSVTWFEQPNLRSTINQADYLAITYNFTKTLTLTSTQTAIAELNPLMQHHRAQGLNSRIIDVQWIYDQFGDGRVDPRAIRDFLQYTYNAWIAPAPSFVLLVGDGTYDPRNFGQAELPTLNYVPPYLSVVDPWIGETAADNKYVTVSGNDDVPDMMLGRIPARSVADVTTFVSKTLAFQQTDPNAAWLKRALFVADDPDSAGNFHALSNDVAQTLPTSVTTTTLYYQSGDNVTTFRNDVVNAINTGQLFVNYIGHAGQDVWAEPVLYNGDSIKNLTNSATPSIMLEMTCYTGYYHDPITQSLAERELLKSDGGAVATWSPTGLGIAYGHDYLNRGFFDAIYNHNVRTIGVATMQGKLDLAASGIAPDLLNTFLLFGDPALTLPLADPGSITAVADEYVFDQNVRNVVLDVRANDLAGTDETVIISVTQPTHGNVTISQSGKTLLYTPDLWYHGSDSLTYTIRDNGTFATSTATVTFTLNDTTRRIYLPLIIKN